jgi:hypothetical protein
MYDHCVIAVRPERTERATRFPVRPEHKVLHNELTAAVKKFCEPYRTIQRFKNIILIELKLGQSPPLCGEHVPGTCMGFSLSRKATRARIRAWRSVVEFSSILVTSQELSD